MDPRRGRAARVRHRRAERARAEHRARSRADAALPEEPPGVEREPRVRVGEPGHHRRRRPDRARPRRHRHRRRRGVALERPDPALARLQRRADRREQGEVARASGSARSSKIRPRDLIPITPAIAEPSTGETHGTVGREDGQAEPHRAGRAGRARAGLAPQRRRRHEGRPAHRRNRAGVRPAALRPDARRPTTASAATRSLEQLAKLKPVFDRRYGTVTAGNASPLTDGGAAVLLMSEERAKALGFTPLAYIRSYAYAAIDPGEQLLQAPVFAAPMALERAGLSLQGHRPRGDARGVRGAGALEPAGVRVAVLGGARRIPAPGRRGGP